MARITKTSRRRGITLIDTLVATMIVTVAMVGSVGIFMASSNMTNNVVVNTVGASLARRGIEEARSQGFVWCTTDNGAVPCDGTTTAYYDNHGQVLANSTGSAYTVTTSVTSSSLTSGVPDSTSLRTVIVTVKNAAGSTLYTTGSYLTWGGI